MITFQITDAGWTAWLNAQATGTDQLTIAEVAFGDQARQPSPADTQLGNERARVPAVGGQDIGPQRIHVTATEDGPDAYPIYEIGLILDDGTLFAQWASDTDTAGTKSGLVPYVLVADLVFEDLPDGAITIDQTSISFPPATETWAGRIEIADQPETDAEEDDTRAITPLKLGNRLTPIRAKTDLLTVTAATDLDAIRTKAGHLTVTAATDLDAIRARVAELDAAVVLVGSWDPATGSFPGGGNAGAGESWLVTGDGTVDGVAFTDGDRLVALVDNAPAGAYAGNWLKMDYTDRVSSVAGRTGNVSLDVDDIAGLGAAAELGASGDAGQAATTAGGTAGRLVAWDASGNIVASAYEPADILSYQDYGIGQTSLAPVADLNAVSGAGIYGWEKGVTVNLPSDLPATRVGWAWHGRVPGPGGGMAETQMLVENGVGGSIGGEIRTRYRAPNNGTWSAWRKYWSDAEWSGSGAQVSNGYQHMPGGLILQWGTANGGDAIVFQRAYQVACFGVCGNVVGAPDKIVYSENVAAAGFTLRVWDTSEQSHSNTTAFWFAIGR